MIHASASEPLGVAPHSAEAPANPVIPISTMRLDPMTSANRPPNAKPAARARMYPFTTHCTPLLDSASSSWIRGVAIETIV